MVVQRTMGELLGDALSRLGRVERRLARVGGASGGISDIQAGAGIGLAGSGSLDDPLVISNTQAPYTLPARLGASASAHPDNDLNNAIDSGWYTCSTATANTPTSTGAGLCVVYRRSTGGAIRQEFYRIINESVAQMPDPRIWIRVSSDGGTTWGPWRLQGAVIVAQGQVSTAASIAVNGHENVTVTFPTNRFTVAPQVYITPGSGRANCAFSSVTTSGFTLGVDNWSPANLAPFPLNWIAFQLLATAAAL